MSLSLAGQAQLHLSTWLCKASVFSWHLRWISKPWLMCASRLRTQRATLHWALHAALVLWEKVLQGPPRANDSQDCVCEYTCTHTTSACQLRLAELYHYGCPRVLSSVRVTSAYLSWLEMRNKCTDICAKLFPVFFLNVSWYMHTTE